jgi:hypothetical protein
MHEPTAEAPVEPPEIRPRRPGRERSSGAHCARGFVLAQLS